MQRCVLTPIAPCSCRGLIKVPGTRHSTTHCHWENPVTAGCACGAPTAEGLHMASICLSEGVLVTTNPRVTTRFTGMR